MIVGKSPCIPDEIRPQSGLDSADCIKICSCDIRYRRPEGISFQSAQELAERLTCHAAQLFVQLSSGDEVLLYHGCIDACLVHPEESDQISDIDLSADVLEQQAATYGQCAANGALHSEVVELVQGVLERARFLPSYCASALA